MSSKVSRYIGGRVAFSQPLAGLKNHLHIKPRPISADTPEVSNITSNIWDRLHHMKRQTVSLCLIARNEESSIGMAIKSVLALVDEVVVVDTGSTDNTRIIAEGYGARVVDVSWSDDFSAARNAALDEATCNWILVLDADEFLQPIRPVEFQRLLHNPGIAGYRLQVGSNAAEEVAEDSASLRLFRRDQDVRYSYPIFEQLEPSLKRWADPQGLVIADSNLVVLSETESSENPSNGRERNLRILRKALDAHPREPYFPYKLACEGLAMLDDEVLPVAGLNRSIGYLNQAWRLVSKFPQEESRCLAWLPDLGVKVASALLTLNRYDEAMQAIDQVLHLFPDNASVRLQKAAVEIQFLAKKNGEASWRQQTSASLKETLQELRAQGQSGLLSATEKRIYTLYSLRYLGDLALVEGKVSDAVGHFEQALSLDPEYSYGWLGMAECSRFAGDRKRALKLYLRTVTESPDNFRAWLRGCDLMMEMDFNDNAASWRHRAQVCFPEHPEILAAAADGGNREPALQKNG